MGRGGGGGGGEVEVEVGGGGGEEGGVRRGGGRGVGRHKVVREVVLDLTDTPVLNNHLRFKLQTSRVCTLYSIGKGCQ